jgi:hypothetical protein
MICEDWIQCHAAVKSLPGTLLPKHTHLVSGSAVMVLVTM